MAEATETVPVAAEPAEPQAKAVTYCAVCSLPPEYCEFGGTVQKCEEWLSDSEPAMHAQLYSHEALTAATADLSLDAQRRAGKDAAKKAAKASAAAAKEEERRATAKVLIRRVERNKRKFVTAVSGLEAHGLDLKKVAKELGKRFAAGSSVTKTPTGGEEIILQGDLSDDVFDYLTENYSEVPEQNVECVDDKRKKAV